MLIFKCTGTGLWSLHSAHHLILQFHPPPPTALCICLCGLFPSCHTVQTEAVGVSETFLNLYHAAPCTSNDSNRRDVSRYNPHSKLPIHSIPFASSLDISQSFSALYNRYVTQPIGRFSLLYVVIPFPFFSVSWFHFRDSGPNLQQLIERLVNPPPKTKKQTNRISVINFWVRFRSSALYQQYCSAPWWSHWWKKIKRWEGHISTRLTQVWVYADDIVLVTRTKQALINLLTPNVNYSCRTAPLTSKFSF